MGSIVAARCACGFRAEMMLGSGELSGGALCIFPARCEGCERFLPINLLAPKQRCPSCGGERFIPYDDPSLAGKRGSKNVFSWNLKSSMGRIARLSNGTYRCPACGETTLRFERTGIWD